MLVKFTDESKETICCVGTHLDVCNLTEELADDDTRIADFYARMREVKDANDTLGKELSLCGANMYGLVELASVAINELSEDEQVRLHKWAKYKYQLSKVDMNNPIWPERPE